jgi:hypothetical protein
MARYRERQRNKLVWSDDAKGMVWPVEHEPSANVYKATGCQHCLPDHAYRTQLGRIGDDETAALSLGALALTDLRQLAEQHLAVRQQTVPPPPPPRPGTTTGRHHAQPGRHARSDRPPGRLVRAS